MNFLRPPKTEYTDHYDVMRFNLVWNLCITLSILLTVVSLINLTNDNYTSTTNVVEVGIGLIALFILARTKRFRVVCIFITVGSFLLIAIAFFSITHALHYTTPMWGTLNVLFAFLMLGRYWGAAILIGQFGVLMFYYTFRLQSNISNLPPFETPDIMNFIIETSIVGMAMAYLLIKFIQAHLFAEKEVKKTNEELRIQNEIISTQSKEREIMLKEIHHRVKNNLQVITSILRLQSQDIKPEDQPQFTEAINRVKSMALIHEKMYQSDTLANFDLENYLTSLTNDLIVTYSIKKPIDLQVNSEINEIDSKSIVPISLLFNELISNSIKHGFEHKKSGQIHVNVKPGKAPENIDLSYSDNGVWKEQSRKSFGLELIHTMTEQLDGDYSLKKTSTGTHYQFSLRALEE